MSTIDEIKARRDAFENGLAHVREDREAYHRAKARFEIHAPADIDTLLARIAELEAALRGLLTRDDVLWDNDHWCVYCQSPEHSPRCPVRIGIEVHNGKKDGDE